jgi:hypothetical protein
MASAPRMILARRLCRGSVPAWLPGRGPTGSRSVRGFCSSSSSSPASMGLLRRFRNLRSRLPRPGLPPRPPPYPLHLDETHRIASETFLAERRRGGRDGQAGGQNRFAKQFLGAYCASFPSISYSTSSNGCGPTRKSVPKGRSRTKIVKSTKAMPAANVPTVSRCSR